MSFFGLTTTRSKKKDKKKIKELKGEVDRLSSVDKGPDYSALKNTALMHAEKMNQIGNQGRAEGRKRGEEFFARKFEGLTPEQRSRYETDANRRISREVERNQRELIGKQGVRGVKGGAAFAQRAELARLGDEARRDARNQLQNLDQDLALKKMAAQFAIEEGGASDRLLNNQLAYDELVADEERKRQKKYEDKFNRNFSRI